MKTKLIPILTSVFCLLTSGAYAQVPGLINYQGRLVDGGTPVNSNVVVAICIYTGETAVVAAHVEDVGSVPVVNGLYAFTFGTNETGMAAALAEPEAWLEVKIDAVPLTPRQRLISVPYSRNSAALGSILAESPNPAAGAVRWNGSAFEGYDGTDWIPLSTPSPLVEPEMVVVGNEGNANDTGGGGDGAVSYTYKIGKYEVTNTEYTEFLNAVDPNGLNALALYNASMNSSSQGGITLTGGNPAGSKYVLKGGFSNKPVVFVNFYDAMRYCNWLHNAAQAGGDTDSGAYSLTGNSATPSNGLYVVRNPGAKFAVPTEDEWYKAAYYDPVNAGADVGGNVDYWLYPTQSDSAPIAEAPPGGANSANYFAVGNVTDVGAYTGSPSHYGTFDQGGNVFEWNETLSGSSRVLRGGSWFFNVLYLRSVSPGTFTPGLEVDDIGFRVSSP